MTEQETSTRQKRKWNPPRSWNETSERSASIPPTNRTSRWAQSSWQLMALPLLLFFAVPIVMLLARTTPGQLLENLQNEKVVQAIGISLRTTLISLAITLFFGTPVAYLMGRRQFRFKRLVDTLIDLPTVLPPSVAGVALLITFGRTGLVGGWLESWGLQIAFTPVAVILAQVFISAPFYVRAVSLGFASVDLEIEQAAHLDGANRWQAFRYVLLPLSRSSVISGGMMSWARALGEFGATMIFAGNFPGRTQTMPTAIYLGFEIDLNLALTLSAILLGVSFLSILVLKGLSGRIEAS